MTKKWKTHILIYRSVNFYSFISCPIIASLVTDANHRCRNGKKHTKNKTLLPLYPCCRVSHFHQTLATQLIRIMAATISWKLTTVTPSHQKTWKVCMPVPLSTIPALNFITRPHYENMMLGYCQLVSLNKRFPLFRTSDRARSASDSNFSRLLVRRAFRFVFWFCRHSTMHIAQCQFPRL